MSTLSGSGPDPRLTPPPPEPPLAPLERPAVGRATTGAPSAFWLLVFVLVGVVVFLWLNGRRNAADSGAAPIAEQAAGVGQPAPTPLPEGAVVAAQGEAGLLPPPQAIIPNGVPIMDATPGAPATLAQMGPALPSSPYAAGSVADRRKAPAVVVDLGGGGFILPTSSTASPEAAAALAARSAAAGGATGAGGENEKGSQLSSDEQFADRIAGAASTAPERARATALRNLDATIPQGALISAVLETAINSDLPGYARAVVSRDVKSFDGTKVLIPRGSRLVGQYKSGVALGASRVFVIWTRILRPDGVSVQIASPGTDSLGRGGLDGEVDRHFMTRFGGSILLSVINAGVGALSRGDNASIYIGSSNDATNVAAAAFAKDGAASPTIRTPQGAAVRVFVARDLDFSGVR